MFCMVFALFGIPLNLMVLRHIGDRVNQVIGYIHYLIETKLLKRESEIVATKTLMWTLLVLIVMLFVGAFLYLQEEEWNFLEGVYFCFITFSTIGFGDLVPNGGKKVMSFPHRNPARRFSGWRSLCMGWGGDSKEPFHVLKIFRGIKNI